MAGNVFKHVRANRPRRTPFDLSHGRKFSCKGGEIVPILCQEVVPGDTFKDHILAQVRLAPQLTPVMHDVHVKKFTFFVPMRLLWNEWENFITAGPTGQSAPIKPHFVLSDIFGSSGSSKVDVGSLADYLGFNFESSKLPSSSQIKLDALPFRAYTLIYNEYFRDQNLESPIEFTLRSGTLDYTDDGEILNLRKSAWEKDYFTSALPWPQRGQEVTLPIGGRAPVNYETGNFGQLVPTGTGTVSNNPLYSGTGSDGTGIFSGDPSTPSSVSVNYDPNGTLYADLADATATSINDLRTSIALQHWYERSARGGSRYIEQIGSHFGVRSSDARLQRPEFLAGSRTPIYFSEVLQTSSSDGASPQANMAGHGYSFSKDHRFKAFFEEYGYLMSFMVILPKTAYQQGLPRQYQRWDNFDHYWPDFDHLGEQGIYNSEIYSSSSDPDGVFGYTPRYSEYRYIPTTVHGDFRTTLNFWHMGRIFQDEPKLNKNFVISDPTTRIFAVTDPDYDHYWVQVHHNLFAVRPMSRFSTPGLKTI